MSWSSMSFLIQNYWIYLVIAFAVGVVAGWISVGPQER